MTTLSAPELLNPMLHQALRRRRLRRRSRLLLAGWLVFGAIHIALWWVAYDSTGLHVPTGLLGLLVWPLLLASTACFIGFLGYRIRRTIDD
ncbi:hypothetical protein FHX74_002311 [Friedmanniella endophytica]|uniref:Uncharacterized protein n=1 Tax=Microlunatus kandeliicorticis TaxID=1759536 RepID=A0A7W3ISZ2_9ACTN|nr:hypothetical protein [Microlunatus kandeliicorticis]MBA8794692.1 hypothetical protein [Microlunatus kandeliicorticis]